MTDDPMNGDGGRLEDSVYETPQGVVDGESEIPWKPPVIAAILGALLVAVYVVYAIVTGPGPDDVVSTTPGPAPSTVFPPGYVEVANRAGARVESIISTETSTIAFLSTSVPGSTDPAAIPPLEVAFWELSTASGSVSMTDQYRWPGASGSDGGSLTVVFPAVDTGSAADASIVAHPVLSAGTASLTIDAPTTLPVELNDVRIAVGGDAVVIDTLTVDADGGYVQWRAEGDMPARVDTIVTFEGTATGDAGDAVLLPIHLGAFLVDPVAFSEPVPVAYTFASRDRLVRSGAEPDPARPPTGVTVEFRVALVDAVADPVSLTVDR